MKKLFIVLALFFFASVKIDAQPQSMQRGWWGWSYGEGHHGGGHHGGGGGHHGGGHHGGGGCHGHGHGHGCHHAPIDSVYWMLAMLGIGAGIAGYSLYKDYEDKK